MQRSPDSRRFLYNPLPIPEGGLENVQRDIKTINFLYNILHHLDIAPYFPFRRGKRLQISIIGDGRAEEFIAVQKFFGITAGVRVIEKDAHTLNLGRLRWQYLAEETGISLSREPTFVEGDVFKTDRKTQEPVLVKGQNVICAFALHPGIVQNGGVDAFVDALAPGGYAVFTKLSDVGTGLLLEAITKRVEVKNDIVIRKQGYVQSDGHVDDYMRSNSSRHILQQDQYAISLQKQ